MIFQHCFTQREACRDSEMGPNVEDGAVIFHVGNILHCWTGSGVWGQAGAVHVSDCSRCSVSFHCWLYTNLHSALHLTWSFIESGHLLTELGSKSSPILTSSGFLRRLGVKKPWNLPFNAPRLPLSHWCGTETVAPPESLLLLKFGPVTSNATGGPTARNSSSDWQTLGGVLFPQTLAQHLLTILRSVCWFWYQWKSGHCDQ